MRKLFMILCCTLVLCVNAPGRTAQPTAPAVDIARVADVRPEFIRRLKAVADRGDLYDPAAIGALLGMTLQTGTSTTTEDCEGRPGQSTIRTVNAVPDRLTWYHPMPAGMQRVELPALAINPASTTGPAELLYTIDHVRECDADYGLADHTTATLTFQNLLSFACITGADLTRLLPQGEGRMATDGVSIYAYQGRIDDAAGITLDFTFYGGERCAMMATIMQNQQRGIRFERARYAHARCLEDAADAFCAAYMPFGPPDDMGRSTMEVYAAKACPPINKFYQDDKEHGTPPSGSSWRKDWTSCGGDKVIR